MLVRFKLIAKISIARDGCTMTTPLEVVHAFERHVTSEAAMGLSTLEGAVAGVMPVLSTRLRKLPKVSMEEATALNEYLAKDNGTFNLEQRREISKLVKPLIESDVAKTVVKQGAATQSHQHQHHYYPAKLWDMLSSDAEMEVKLRAVSAFYCQNLGLRNPDEPTKRQAVVIAYIASGLSPEPSEAYNMVRKFSKIMDQKRDSIQSAQTMSTFPKDPSEFTLIYPTAFGEQDPPVACRIDETLIAERCRSDMTPCRNTNALIATPPSSSSLRVSQQPKTTQSANDNSMQSLVFGLMERLMFSGDNRTQNHANLRRAMGDTQGSRESSANLHIVDEGELSRKVARSTDSDSLVSGSVPLQTIAPPATVHDKLKALSQSVRESSKDALAAAKRRSDARQPSDDEDVGTESDTSEKQEAEKEKKRKPETSAKKRKSEGKKVKKEKVTKSKSATKAKSVARPVKAGARRRGKELCENELRVLKKPAKAPRPSQTKKPVEHCGGNIYWAEARKRYRVYLRKGDKVEESLPADPKDKNDMRTKFSLACALIENDPRPQ